MIIRVIDLETTGTEPPAAVCEIGWCDLRATTKNLVGDWSGWEIVGGAGVLISPGVAIPPEVSAIHHIIDQDVVGAAIWSEAAREVMGVQPSAFAAHSAKFERQWLGDDLTAGRPWICTYKCALRLWPDAPSHSNQALRYWRRPNGLDRSVASVAHRAYPDAYVTAFHLRDMLELASLDDLVKWSSEPALQVICHIGKYRGTPWKDVDTGFMCWVRERDFGEDVHFTIDTEFERRRSETQSQDLYQDAI